MSLNADFSGLNKQRKKALRQKMREHLASISIKRWKEAEKTLFQRLILHEAVQSAESILMYVAKNEEIDLRNLENWARIYKKRLYLPKIIGEGRMEFLLWKQDALLKENRFSIPEPDLSSDIWSADKEESAFLLIPGLAFSKDKYRLGRGAAFYDRYLKLVEKARERSYLKVAGPCLKEQLMERLPVDSWDVQLDELIIV